MENLSFYIKKFQIAFGLLFLTVALVVFVVYKTIPVVQNILNIQEQHKTQSASLADAERKLEGLKAQAEQKRIENANLPKAFFKPITEGLDTEAVISDEFGEILQLLRENKIKTRSVNYEYDPQDDNFVKNVAYKYHVCRITAQMIASYADFENFLRDLYKHEHFLEISKIEIVPYEKNKRILLVNLQLKLYAEKLGAQAPPPAPAPDANAGGVPSPQPVDNTGGVSPEAPSAQ